MCRYCLEEVVFDARFVEFVCYECHQRHEELKNVPVEKEPRHAHSASTAHQLNTKPLESAMDAVEWRNREGRFGKYYSRKKGSKRNPTTQPGVSNLASRKTETTANDPGGFTTKLFGVAIARRPGGVVSSNMEVDLDLNLPVPSLPPSVLRP